MVDPSDGAALDPETRKYILEVWDGLERRTHYELLGVARDADKKTIKRAYFRLAATLHPDRYFGKDLGSFKSKMELLFKRISEAHDTLLAADRRAQYDARLGNARVGPAAPQPEDPRAAQQRKADEEERQKKLEAGRALARPHVEAALRAKNAGDLAAAVAAYRQARAVLPDDPDLERAALEVQRAFAERASEALVRQAELEERHGHWAQAVVTWKRIAVARPGDPKVRERLTQAMARARGAG